MVEHKHGFGKTQSVRERPARHDRARKQVFRTRHAFARRENFTTRIHRMRSVHHRARFRGHGRQVVERVQAHLPRSMQIGRRTAHGEKRLARRELIAVGPRAHDFAPALFGDAPRHRHAREHARLAREEFHSALLGTNAQDLAREVDIRNIFGNELVNSRIGYAQHVFPLMRLWRDNYSCFRIAVLAAGASLNARWWPPVIPRPRPPVFSAVSAKHHR